MSEQISTLYSEGETVKQLAVSVDKIAVGAGILGVDEIRELEGFNPKGQAA